LPEPTGATGPSVLVKDGVVGRWALDCAKPFSVENPHLLYSLPSSGGASEQVLMDAKHDRTTTLQDIAELEGGFVQWSQKAGQGLATIVTKIDGSRLQTWHAKHSDGTLMVDKGRYAGGSEVPWFSRCAAN
jgi:hypothetical protein